MSRNYMESVRTYQMRGGYSRRFWRPSSSSSLCVGVAWQTRKFNSPRHVVLRLLGFVQHNLERSQLFFAPIAKYDIRLHRYLVFGQRVPVKRRELVNIYSRQCAMERDVNKIIMACAHCGNGRL